MGQALARDRMFRYCDSVLNSVSRTGWCPIALLLVSACGGRTELDATPLPRTKPSPAALTPTAPAKPQGSGAGSGDNKGSGDDLELGSSELGECLLGTKPGAGQPCTFLAEQRCYPDSPSACACICPRDQDTTCVEGLFPNQAGALEVHCYVL